MAGTLTLNGTGSSESYVDGERDGVAIRNSFTPFPTYSHGTAQVFNIHDTSVGGVVRKQGGDESAPTHIESTTLGGNHGWLRTRITVASHGKTDADVGSIFTLSSVEYVISSIRDTNSLYIAKRTTNVVAPTGTYVYVSGGSDTGNMAATAAVADSWFQPFQDRTITLYVDGVVDASTTGTIPFNKMVQFVESYDLINYLQMVAWVEAGNTTTPDALTPMARVEVTYEYDLYGNCVIYQSFTVLGSMSLEDLLFTQAIKTEGTDGTVNYYIPQTLEYAHEGTDYNWQLIDSSDTSGWSTRPDITPTFSEATGNLPNRMVMLSDNYGYAVGYLPVLSGTATERRRLVTGPTMQISTSGKFYPHIVDPAGSITPAVGTVYSAISYRVPIVLTAGRTCSYVVRTTGSEGSYLFSDWHNTDTSDAVPVPSDFVGRGFSVVESRNATVTSSSGSTVGVDILSASDYAYLILRYDSMNVMQEWKGAVEPSEASATGNQLKKWKGAVEPIGASVSSSGSTLIGGVTRNVTRNITRSVTESFWRV